MKKLIVLFLSLTFLLSQLSISFASGTITRDQVIKLYNQNKNLFEKPNQATIESYQSLFSHDFDNVKLQNYMTVETFTREANDNPKHVYELYQIASKKLLELGQENYRQNIGKLDQVLYAQIVRVTNKPIMTTALSSSSTEAATSTTKAAKTAKASSTATKAATALGGSTLAAVGGIALAAAALGGGGGGKSASASSALPIDWTVTGANAGPSAYVRDLGSSSSAGAGSLCFPSSETCTVGAEIEANATTDSFKFTSDYGSNEIDFSTGFEFSKDSIVSSEVDTNGSAYGLQSTDYEYSQFDVTSGRTKKITIAIPSNYSYQYWLYWDDTHTTISNPSSQTYFFGMIGKEFTLFSNLPSTGTATYTGGTAMIYSTPSANYVGNGSASFNVNWGTKKISGTLGSIALVSPDAANTSFPQMAFAESDIVQSTYSCGGCSAQPYVVFNGALTYSGQGTASSQYLKGHFYGPAYEEAGGVFHIVTSGSNHGVGLFAAKK